MNHASDTTALSQPSHMETSDSKKVSAALLPLAIILLQGLRAS